MQALTKCCLLGRTLASGGQREYPRYQSSSQFQDCCFSRTREARDSARATLQAMTLAWEEQWPKCAMSHDTSPLAISDTLEASTGPGRSSSSRRNGCTPLLQPWCGNRNRQGTSPSIGSRSLGHVWPCQQASHPLNCLWILALPEKATRPGIVVAALCSFCNSPCTAQRFHQVANDHGGSCRVDVWTSVFVWSTTIDAPNLRRVSLKSGRQFSARFLSTWRAVAFNFASRAATNGCLGARLQVSEALW